MGKGAATDFRAYLTLVAISLIASSGFYSFPLAEVPVNVDSAVFSYVGEVMAAGGLPYVDVFDHKGPLLYLLNLLGALGPSTWVLWLVEWLFLAASLCMGYAVGRTVGAPRLAAAAVAVILVSYIVFHAEGGNMTEEYCLPFMLASVLLASRAIMGAPFRMRHALCMGASAACVFMVRFTELAGLVPFCIAALAVTWARRGARRALSRLAGFALAFAAVAGAFAAWLGTAGALPAFIEQYFGFNLVYASAADAASRWGSLRYFAGDPAFLLAVVATGAALALCWAYRGNRCGREMALALVNLAGLAALFAVAAASGRSYGHYLLMFVPMYFVAYNAAVLQVCRAARKRAVIAVIGAVIGLGLVYLPASFGSVSQLAYRSTLADARAEAVDALGQAAPDGKVLVVGNECWAYLDGGFRAPAPYAYRSDAMAEAYDEWLSGIIAGGDAPSAIAVADYVDLDVPLASYRHVATAGNLDIYQRMPG